MLGTRFGRRRAAGRAAALAGALVCLGASAAAQNGGLRGRVLDPAGDPVEGVEVTLSFLGGVNRTLTTESDGQGNFVRMGIRLGEYRLALRREGFRPHEEDIRIRPGAPTRVGEITLQPVAPVPVAAAPTGSRNLQVGQQALAGGDYQAAAVAFRDETIERPESGDAHRLLGVALRLAGQTDEARSALERAVEASPDSAPAWTALADLEAGLGRWEETAAALETALGLDPESRDLRFRLGGALMNAGDLDGAAEAFDGLSDDAPAAYQLAMIALNRGRNEEAIAHLERVLELDPDGPDADRARGILTALRPG